MIPRLTDLSSRELRDLLASGAVSSRDAAADCLARIEELNPKLGALLTLTGEQAMDDAAALDERFARSGQVGPLHGLPTAFKDLVDVRGVTMSYGTAAIPPRVAEADSPLVATLRTSGVVSVGKTQVPEFGLSCHSENLIGPPARLPQDPTRSAGGSSGGSAAAVAARMIPFAIGSDGGGSVRIPASACGLLGLKPNRGRLADGSGQSDLGRLVVAGPLTHDAADAALLMDVLAAAPNPRALSAVPPSGSFADAVDRCGDLPPLRIGVSTASPFESVYDIALDEHARAALERAVAGLTELGHDVVDADVRYDPRYPEAFASVWTTGVATIELPDGGEVKLTPLARSFRERAQRRTAAQLASAIETLRRFEGETVEQYAAYDVVLTPAMATIPPPIGWFTGTDFDLDADTDYERQCQYTPYTSMLNVVGLPALTLTTHYASVGDAHVPMGVQLIGRPSAEATLLALAAQWETVQSGL